MPTDRADDLPPGYSLNTEDQLEKIRAAATAVAKTLEGTVPAVALVLSMPDGTVTVGLVGSLDNLFAFTNLLAMGPDVLRHTVARCLEGKGKTSVVSMVQRCQTCGCPNSACAGACS